MKRYNKVLQRYNKAKEQYDKLNASRSHDEIRWDNIRPDNPYEIWDEATWDIYDPCEAKLIAKFYDQKLAQEYLDELNRPFVKKVKKAKKSKNQPESVPEPQPYV